MKGVKVQSEATLKSDLNADRKTEMALLIFEFQNLPTCPVAVLPS